MYSLVLMVAMSQGAAAPGWQSGEVDLRGTTFIHASAHQHYRHGCHGCHGCCGGGYGGCYGGCCGGYGGWGCCGGGYGGSGCCGGGYAGWGCSGGCYGGYAGGGYGGGYASSMPYGGYATMPAYGGYMSGYYTPGSYAPGSAVPGAALPADRGGRGAEGASPADRGGRGSGDEGTSRDKESLAPAPATLVVTLPAEARLAIDDHATRATSATRTFVTPPLTPGQEYHYTLTAELRRGEEPVTVNKRVTVRAGEETRVALEFPPATVAEK